jgi:predicted Zn-dependent protease
MSKKQTTVLMAAVLAVATVLAAGLTVLPASVQEAQANPCSNNLDVDESSNDNRIGELDDQECDLTGAFIFDED